MPDQIASNNNEKPFNKKQITIKCHILVQGARRWEIFILHLFGQPKPAIKAAYLYCPRPTAHTVTLP